MALREHPYLPLYTKDFLTDEKLNECSAQATGVYIRLLCIMHKSETYGKILLKQNAKQTDKQNLSMCYKFALQLVRHMPYSFEVILESIDELINEKVIYIDGEYLCQKRMIKDNELSLIRSKSGKIGGDKNKFAQAKTEANIQAKEEANAENENESVIDINNDNKDTNTNTTLPIKSNDDILIGKEKFFIEELSIFKEQYGNDMLISFFLYWSEKSKDGKRLRFELEKTWDLSKRLARWKINDKPQFYNKKEDKWEKYEREFKEYQKQRKERGEL